MATDSTARTKFHSVYGTQRFRGNTVHQGTVEVDGDTQIKTINPVSGSADSTGGGAGDFSVTEATHAGRTTALPNPATNTVITMPAPVEGVQYHFIYVSDTVAAHNFAFDLAETGTYEGNITHLDTSADENAVVVNCGKANNDLLTAVTPLAMDLHFVGKDTSSYYVWGSISGGTIPTCADG